MPRISDERREERRQQYLDAARRRIGRTGIAGTRREDITAEAGLSSGSTYLYFATKDELIRAAIQSSLARFEAMLSEVAESAGPDLRSFLKAALERIEGFASHVAGVDLFRLAIQGWAFAQTDEPAALLVRESFGRITQQLEGLDAALA